MTKVSVLMSVYNGETYPGSHRVSLNKPLGTLSSSLWMMAQKTAWQILVCWAGFPIVLIRNEQNIGLVI